MQKINRSLLKHTKNLQGGFTLIELLIVIVIITALAVTVFVALNPVKRTQDAREARRTSDVETILTAVHEYIVDNKGALPTGLSTSMALTQMGTGAACTLAAANVPAGWAANADPNLKCVTGNTCVNLTAPLATYLKSLPVDPKAFTSGATPLALAPANSGYAVSVDANNIVTVVACGGENATTPISQSR